jgi:hypothetical protein
LVACAVFCRKQSAALRSLDLNALAFRDSERGHGGALGGDGDGERSRGGDGGGEISRGGDGGGERSHGGALGGR